MGRSRVPSALLRAGLLVTIGHPPSNRSPSLRTRLSKIHPNPALNKGGDIRAQLKRVKSYPTLFQRGAGGDFNVCAAYFLNASFGMPLRVL